MTPEEKRAKGLYNKFEVKRTDGQSEPGQKHENCRYFVLDLDCDPYAIPAIQAYAEACDDEYPNLALDLQLNFGRQPPAAQDVSVGAREAKSREAFESHCIEAHWWLASDFVRDEADDYFSGQVQKDWEIWQAAQSASIGTQAHVGETGTMPNDVLALVGDIFMAMSAAHKGPPLQMSALPGLLRKIAALITADRALHAREARELSEDQRQGLRLALETIISEISERCYCAGWVTGVEVNMWAFVTGERDREQGYGQGHVFDTEITAMHTLATLLGEWPCWEGDNMEWKPIELPTLALSQQTAKGGGEQGER
jgi:hypothetical protein